VDDYTTTADVVLDSMYIRELNDFFTDSGNAELLIMNSVDGHPGDTVFNEDLPATITNIDEYHFGLPTFWLKVSPGVTLPAGTYFIGLRSIGTDWDEFIGTAPVVGSECYYQSDFYHVPNFIPSSTPISEGGFGQAYDMNYCVFTHEAGPSLCDYTPGDINGNGTANGIDVVFGVNYFKGIGVPPVDCHPICTAEPNPFYAAGDVNGNCTFNGIDITFFVRYLKGQVPNLLFCADCPPAPIAAPAVIPILKGINTKNLNQQ
jgi:hypothetical protein